MNSLNRYDNIVLAYQYEYSESGETHDDDVGYYISKLAGCRGRVLELGCGTGRVTLPLRQAGLNVTGLDQAKAMIQIAKRKALKKKLKIPFLLANAVTFKRKGKFDAVIFPYNSISMIPEKYIDRFIHNLKQHLLPGAHFLFDISRSTRKFRNPRERQTEWTEPSFIKELNTTIRRKTHLLIDPKKYVNEMTYFWEMASKNKIKQRRTKMVLSIRPVNFYLGKLKALGFELLDEKEVSAKDRTHYFLELKI